MNEIERLAGLIAIALGISILTCLAIATITNRRH